MARMTSFSANGAIDELDEVCETDRQRLARKRGDVLNRRSIVSYLV